MAKNRNTNNTNTTNDITNESTESVEVVVPIETVQVTESAIEVVAHQSSELAIPQEPTWLDQIPALIRNAFEMSQPVDQEEMTAMIEQLPDDARVKFEEMIEKMNPVKAGMIVAETQFKVFDARIFHGIGDDAGRPASAPVGSVYTSDSNLLAVWDKNQAKQLKTEQTFVAAVVGMMETRTWWRPRDKSVALPPDVDAEGNAPICKSMDRKRGDRYGICPACPHRPYANGKYEQNSCTDEVKLYFMLKDFSGLYQMTLKGKSIRGAVYPLKRFFGAQANMWDRWIEFGLKEEKNESGRWFALTAALYDDGNSPKGVNTLTEERGVLSALSRQILNEVYKPALRAIYEKSPSNTPEENVADMNALKNSVSGTGPLPDASKDNI